MIKQNETRAPASNQSSPPQRRPGSNPVKLREYGGQLLGLVRRSGFMSPWTFWAVCYHYRSSPGGVEFPAPKTMRHAPDAEPFPASLTFKWENNPRRDPRRLGWRSYRRNGRWRIKSPCQTSDPTPTGPSTSAAGTRQRRPYSGRRTLAGRETTLDAPESSQYEDCKDSVEHHRHSGNWPVVPGHQDQDEVADAPKEATAHIRQTVPHAPFWLIVASGTLYWPILASVARTLWQWGAFQAWLIVNGK